MILNWLKLVYPSVTRFVRLILCVIFWRKFVSRHALAEGQTLWNWSGLDHIFGSLPILHRYMINCIKRSGAGYLISTSFAYRRWQYVCCLDIFVVASNQKKAKKSKIRYTQFKCNLDHKNQFLRSDHSIVLCYGFYALKEK